MEDIHAEDVLFMMLQDQDLKKTVPADGKNLVSKETGWGLLEVRFRRTAAPAWELQGWKAVLQWPSEKFAGNSEGDSW